MTFNASRCEGCPIEGQHVPLEQAGSIGARFLVVTDRPSMSAAASGRLIPPAAMAVFAEGVKTLGFSRNDFRFTPMCHCPYNPDQFTTREQAAIHRHCRTHLLAEIENGGASVVVPLGADATSQVLGRSTKITKVRGLAKTHHEFPQQVFPLMAPGLVVRYPQNAPLFTADLESFGRFVDAEYDADSASAMDDQEIHYERVNDLQFLVDQNPEIVSFDTETTGLRWYKTGPDVRTYREASHKGNPAFSPRFQILTMQFSIAPGQAYMLVWDHPEAPAPEHTRPRLRNQIRALLCAPGRIVIGQGAKFDNVGLWTQTNIRFRIGGDTHMLATLLDENQTERNLDVLTKLHVPAMAGYADKFNVTVDKARMWETSLASIQPYGCGDADAALRVYYVLEEKVAADQKLWQCYCRMVLPGLNAFAAIETRGMYTDDVHALPEFKQLMAAEVEAARRSLLEEIPREVKRDVLNEYCAKHRSADAAQKALSFTRAGFLQEVLFSHRRGFRLKPQVFTKSTQRLLDVSKRVPSVSAKDHLPYFFDKCPFTARLASYVKDSTLLEKSVIKFEEKYIVDGKVRPAYHLGKAVTGRTVSEDPNGQNFPKRGPRAKAYRTIFVAPPGYFVCENDLSQAELRIAACMSRDPTMLRIYASGGDIHEATACIVLGVTPEVFATLPKAQRKEARQKAKAVNFGFLYGMGWRKFIVYAKTQYNVEFTEDEAKRVRAGFFRLYRCLESWHISMRAFAAARKFVRSFSGRIRHLPMIDSPDDAVRMEAERQAINSPVQEFGSSLGVMALGLLDEEIDPEYLQVVGFVHDALVYYVKKEYLDWGMKTVKSFMENVPLEDWFGIELPIPIVADVGFGPNLGAIVEVGDYGRFKLDEPFDFDCLRGDDGEKLIEVPPQLVPPNNGRLSARGPYTFSDDLEDENAPVNSKVLRPRVLHGVLSQTAVRRIEISRKQVLINKRHADAKLAKAKEERAQTVFVRRVKPTTPRSD